MELFSLFVISIYDLYFVNQMFNYSNNKKKKKNQFAIINCHFTLKLPYFFSRPLWCFANVSYYLQISCEWSILVEKLLWVLWNVKYALNNLDSIWHHNSAYKVFTMVFAQLVTHTHCEYQIHVQSNLGYPATSGPAHIRISDLAGYGRYA